MRKSVLFGRAILLLCIGLSFGLLSRFVNEIVSAPYMDEIFHIPQAQIYCHGLFHKWDPKITTPSGPYMFAFFVANLPNLTLSYLDQWIPGLFGDFRLFCSVEFLRLLNQIFSIGTIGLIAYIQPLIHKSQPGSLLVTRATVISIFPVAFFYNFLFYTDSGSSFFVLLSYALSLKDQYLFSAIAIQIALSFRQTNIAWAFFIGFTSLLRLLSRKYGQSWADQVSLSGWNPSLFQQISLMADLIKYAIISLPTLIWNFWGYLFVAGFFIKFVIENGGVALGDKESHELAFHFPQVFYFFSFAAFFGLVSLNPVGSLKDFGLFLWRRLNRPYLYLFLIGAATISFVFIRDFTMSHKFLLSDNRHFSFYIWRYVFQKVAWIRYALIPGYMYVIWLALFKLLQRQTYLWVFSYLVTVAIVLIPTPLIEFRYYILPYLFLRLHIPPVSGRALAAEFFFYAAINGFVFWLFLYKDFEWDSAPGVKQRFMW